MTPGSIEHISEAVREAVKERKRRPRSPAERRSARKSRGKPVLEFSLSAEIVELLKARCDRTGESRSAVVECALRCLLDEPGVVCDTVIGGGP